MDELRLVRDLLVEPPPPAPDRTAAARRRVLAGGRPGWTPNYRRRAVVALAGTVAVAGVVGTSLAAAPPGQPGPPPGGGVAALSASQLLLAAADTAGQAPTAGASWHLSVRSGGQVLTTGGYLIDQRSSEELWLPRSAAQPTWSILQDLGARPATAADVAAWRRAGAPTGWTIPGRVLTPAEQRADAAKHALARRWHPYPARAAVEHVTAAGAAPYAVRTDSRGSAGVIANRPRSLAELAGLPADPERLAAWLRGQLATAAAGPVEGAAVDAELFREGVLIALRLPVSPQVRSAAFRMLAALPGVRLVGPVLDPLGRPGYAVGMPARVGGGGTVEERLVLDLATGRPLAGEDVVTTAYPADPRLARAGQLEGYDAVLGAGWTDARPTLPARRVGPENAAG